ncbi:hypothetical protein CJJ23_01725 [Mycoplasmopsis agassizii]|uniref:Uncharacterized protein n=1 Tax=Mycoplasmopsis agassizii TaxID=33922 RepID=A0A269TJ25_9BACT|nr:hypothetical protein [Mycoplasmopsis agassizii]PAK21492.1 hypothetical protein CJJ23_01725 [Mycoplasmopsis agassizii]
MFFNLSIYDDKKEAYIKTAQSVLNILRVKGTGNLLISSTDNLQDLYFFLNILSNEESLDWGKFNIFVDDSNSNSKKLDNVFLNQNDFKNIFYLSQISDLEKYKNVNIDYAFVDIEFEIKLSLTQHLIKKSTTIFLNFEDGFYNHEIKNILNSDKKLSLTGIDLSIGQFANFIIHKNDFSSIIK